MNSLQDHFESKLSHLLIYRMSKMIIVGEILAMFCIGRRVR